MALIPRPETEGLVEVALQCCRTGVAADIGTGSGAIALSLRQEGQYSEVIGIDLSPAALELARLERPSHRTGGDLARGRPARPAGAAPGRPAGVESALPDRGGVSRLRSIGARLRAGVGAGVGSDGMLATRRLLTDGRQVVVPGRMDGAGSGLQSCATWRRDSPRSWGGVEVAVLDDLFGRARYLRAQLRKTR